MFWDTPVDRAIANLRKQVSAPVRVILWDGREYALSSAEPSVTLRL